MLGRRAGVMLRAALRSAPAEAVTRSGLRSAPAFRSAASFRTARADALAPRGAVPVAAAQPRPLARMSRMVTVYEFSQRLKFLPAELAVAVLIKPVEQRAKTSPAEALALGWSGRPLGPLDAATPLRSRPVHRGTFRRRSFRRSGLVGLGRRTAPAEPLAQRLAHRLPLLVVEPAVAVFVKLLEHPLPELRAAEAAAALARLLRPGRLGDRRQGHQARRHQRRC
jgi:hypothetical protein